MSNRVIRVLVLGSSALVSVYCLVGIGSAQTPATPPAPETPQAQPAARTPGALPTINVETTKKQPAKKQAARRPPPNPRLQPAG